MESATSRLFGRLVEKGNPCDESQCAHSHAELGSAVLRITARRSSRANGNPWKNAEDMNLSALEIYGNWIV